jgi:hypothetical protein
MLGTARLSPTARGASGIAERVARLEEYERWAACERLRMEELVDPLAWESYYKLQEEILEKMREAQDMAAAIRRQIRDRHNENLIPDECPENLT